MAGGDGMLEGLFGGNGEAQAQQDADGEHLTEAYENGKPL